MFSVFIIEWLVWIGELKYSGKNCIPFVIMQCEFIAVGQSRGTQSTLALIQLRLYLTYSLYSLLVTSKCSFPYCIYNSLCYMRMTVYNGVKRLQGSWEKSADYASIKLQFHWHKNNSTMIKCLASTEIRTKSKDGVKKADLHQVITVFYNTIDEWCFPSWL